MSKETVRDRLLAQLARSGELRARVAQDADLRANRTRLREWQAARLARTHADLLESRRFGQAARFFLNDLYGPADLGGHIEDVRRIVPVMTAVLTESGLATVAHAVELNVLSESLDATMVEALDDSAGITDAAYAGAYRAVGRPADRERQIDLIALVGDALDKLTRQKFIALTLRMMRPAAELAGLGGLQSFLERGYAAFGAMGGSGEFMAIVVARERAISAALLAGDDGPLAGRQN